MPEYFKSFNGYDLTNYLPAVFGYVIDSPEKTSRFLLDWRQNINHLFVENFYGEMSKLAKKNNINIFYETASCDIFPADMSPCRTGGSSMSSDNFLTGKSALPH